MITNIRRIQRYLESKIELENEQMKLQEEQEVSLEQPSISLFFFQNCISRFIGPNNKQSGWIRILFVCFCRQVI